MSIVAEEESVRGAQEQHRLIPAEMDAETLKQSWYFSLFKIDRIISKKIASQKVVKINKTMNPLKYEIEQ